MQVSLVLVIEEALAHGDPIELKSKPRSAQLSSSSIEVVVREAPRGRPSQARREQDGSLGFRSRYPAERRADGREEEEDERWARG